MKLAGIDSAVWLIIAVIVIIGKLWNKFVAMQADEDEPAPPPPPVRQRTRPVQRNLPPVRPPVTQPTWEAGPKDLREFMERLTRAPQAKPIPVAPPAPPPVKPAPVAKTAEPSPAKPRPEPQRRASPWAEALRDRQNLRNIIIAVEIIGPPRGA